MSRSANADRAATETLGFVFAFVLVTATVGVVYAAGVGGLHDAQQFEQVNNAQRGFDVFAENVEDVRREGAPSRATELRLGGATLGYGDPVTVRVQANDSDTAANETFVMHPDPVVYSGVEDSEVVYVGGAVFRTDGDRSVMVRDPGYLFGPRRTAVPFLVTYPRGGSDGVSGDSTVLIVAHRQSTGFDRFRASPGADVEMNVTVESPRAEAWRRYFERKGLNVTRANGTVVSAECVTKRVYVPETVVEFELQR